MFTPVRLRVLAITSVIWLVGCRAYFNAAVADETLRFFETISLILFGTLFAWISFSFSMALEGFLGRVRRPNERTGRCESDERFSKNAILVPVYNESPIRVFAAVAAMREQLVTLQIDSEGDLESNREFKFDQFDFYVLSDSTDPEIWLEEEWCWSTLRDSLSDGTRDDSTEGPVNRVADESDDGRPGGRTGIEGYYRHRSENKSRKAGNIADFCEHWGGHYDHMIVLDADSLMTGETLLEMVRRMKADDRLGILQVPPVPVGRTSLFARLQQFSAAVYGPMFAEGFDRFAGDQGNYWGHNAIIRIAAFMRHCQLPVLPGPAPLGGEILSHDFVEASLMVRAGWKVQLANDLGGSYEECPTTILDFVKRDQRWCQGNLQHWQLMLAEGIHPVSRLHFLSGIVSYAAAPLWMLFMVTSVVAAVINERYESWPDGYGGGTTMLWLFLGSVALLVIPKILAVACTLINRDQRRRLGGSFRILASVLVETIASVLFAPIIAVFHTRFVLSVLAGHNVQWKAQQRDEHGVSWPEAAVQFWPLTLLGLSMLVAIAGWHTEWMGWFAPLIAGWIGAIAIAVAMGSKRVGLGFANAGLLLIESECQCLPILDRHQHWIDHIERRYREQQRDGADLFDHLLNDHAFRQQHMAILRAGKNPAAHHEKEPRVQPRSGEPKAIIPKSVEKDRQAMRRRLLCDERWLESV